LRSHVFPTRALALSHSLSRFFDFPSTHREKNFLGESHSPHCHKAKTRKVETWQDEETRQGHWRYPLEFSRASRSSQWIWLLRHQARQAVVWCDNDAIGSMGLRRGIQPKITIRQKLQAEGDLAWVLRSFPVCFVHPIKKPRPPPEFTYLSTLARSWSSSHSSHRRLVAFFNSPAKVIFH